MFAIHNFLNVKKVVILKESIATKKFNAANKHIKDKSLAESMIAQTKQVLETYKRLNKAHDIKPLSRDAVKKVLLSKQGVLEEWADALEIHQE
jgi:CO dehydrogenase/acetyl-CoA synthase gamma subunit (corrinoid Fe-S protein)